MAQVEKLFKALSISHTGNAFTRSTIALIYIA
jgi:hypothetical protein